MRVLKRKKGERSVRGTTQKPSVPTLERNQNRSSTRPLE